MIYADCDECKCKSCAMTPCAVDQCVLCGKLREANRSTYNRNITIVCRTYISKEDAARRSGKSTKEVSKK